MVCYSILVSLYKSIDVGVEVEFIDEPVLNLNHGG